MQVIRDTGDQQLRELRNISKNKTLEIISEIGRKNNKANKILIGIKKINNRLESAEIVCTKTDGTKYNFNIFALPLRFIEKIHNNETTLDEAINNQTELGILINKLNNNYNPKLTKKANEKNNVLKSA